MSTVLLPNSKKVFIGKSKIHGLGVFAKKDIKKGGVVFLVQGKSRTWVVRDQATSLAGPNWIGIGKDEWIEPIGAGPHINHSCEPNAGIKGRVTVIALRNIKRNEEITLDYAITEKDQLWYLNCKCKSKNCRKKICSIQSLPEQTFNQYLPHIPRYFQKVYRKHHGIKK